MRIRQIMPLIIILLMILIGIGFPNQVEGNGEYKEYFDNGNLKIEGNDVDGKREGNFKAYYESGQLWVDGNFKNDLRHGEYKVYHENGNIESITNWDNGKPIGSGKFYHKNGYLMTEVNEADKANNEVLEDGVNKVYHENGKVFTEMTVEKGEVIKFKQYDKEGNLIIEKDFN